jgi:hypothetical protein
MAAAASMQTPSNGQAVQRLQDERQLGPPHDAADELHFDDFLFVFPTHQPLTFSTHERGLIPQICGVVVNKVFARERARVLHDIDT